ncbi:unnamed protein product [Urochloa humidicola]
MADHSLGFFSTVCSRLRAACSSWRRNDGAVCDTQLGQEATVRSRLARRAGAARRFGRNLAFVSFNLEVLLFVYAFWRARRRNLNWRQPFQALPMLLISRTRKRSKDSSTKMTLYKGGLSLTTTTKIVPKNVILRMMLAVFHLNPIRHKLLSLGNTINQVVT